MTIDEKLEKLWDHFNGLARAASDEAEEYDDPSLESVVAWNDGAAWAISLAIKLLKGDDSPMNGLEESE